MANRIAHLQFRIDAAQASMNRATTPSAQARARAVFHKATRDYRSFVEQLHHFVARGLTASGSVILLPFLETARLLSRYGEKQRVLNAQAARNLQGIAHGRFRTFLRSYVRFCADVTVVCADEAFSSRTCFRCGRQSVVGGSKTFACAYPDCGHVADRDSNAAANIVAIALIHTRTNSLKAANGQ